MDDYVTRRRSFKVHVFRITSAFTGPPFSMKKIFTLGGISLQETKLSYSVPWVTSKFTNAQH